MRCSAIALTAILSVCHLFAQPLRFHRYTIHDGLSQSSVKNVLQDQTGFIWFATQDGLNRFDGKNFRVWKRKYHEQPSLSGNNISQVIQTKDGQMWIGTIGGGVNVYYSNADSIEWIRHNPDSSNTLLDDNVFSILHTSLDELWVGSDKGISVIDTRSRNIISQLSTFDVTPVAVTAMVEGNDKNIWVATRHDGVYIFETRTKKKVAHISKSELGLIAGRVDPVRHLFSDKRGRVWVSTNRGLFLCDLISGIPRLKKVKLLTNAHDFTEDVIMCSMLDDAGRLWIGTQNGLLIGEENSLLMHYNHSINNPYSLSDRVILCLYQDNNRVIWIGTYNGVNKFVYAVPKFQSYKFDIQDRSKNLNVVRSLFTEDDTHIFTGTVNALSLFDGNTETIQVITDEQGNNLQNVFCIAKDRRGQLWTGNSNGLQRIRYNGSRYVAEDAIEHPELRVFKNSLVTQCVAVSDDLYLIATLNENGLYLWNMVNKTIKNFRAVPDDAGALPDNMINHILVTENGVVWLATNQGVSLFNMEDNRFKNFFPAGANPVDPGQKVVNAITDDGNILWLATNGGLIRYDPQHQKSDVFTEEHGLANQNLYSCIPANDSILWMSSNKGISEFNTTTQRFTNYDVLDGLQSNEYNRYAWYHSNSGKLYFGGIEGFDVYTPSITAPGSMPMVITGIRIIDKNKFADLYPAHKPLYLHYSQNAIGFEYALLDFEFPRRNNYWCKLEGFDKDWIDNAQHASISYTNLTPGDYVFKVRIKDDETAIASYAFTILTPYWQTKWFTALVVIFILGIFAFIIRQYYLRKMEKQRLIFEKQQAVEYERTRIATDMHDDLGAGLSRIKFLGENIDIKMKRQQPVADDILKIKEYSHEMISKMGEIVWALNKGNDSLSDLLSYMRAYAAEYLMQNSIAATIIAPDDFPSGFVSGEFRRNIFLAVKEALHNIVKHSGSDHVTIEISVTRTLSIVITDNGKGFDPDSKRPHSNGIINMGRRMKDIGGTMAIKNERGTTVTLVAPFPV